MSDITWLNQKRKLSDLKPWSRNPRQINKDQAKRLAESFDEFGQVETIAVGPENEVYNGHQRLSVLLDKHGKDYEVEVRVSSRALTEKEREKLTVFLHKGAAGEWNFDMLANEFEVDELVEWGFSPEELGIEVEKETKDAEPQIDRAAELNEKWQVKAGDLWQIGEHRLLCGDSTKREDVERVMQGELGDMVFTDPPWNVDYKGGTKIREELENDNIETGWDEWLTSCLANVKEFCKSNSPGYVFFGLMRAGDTQIGITSAGWKIYQTLVWVKQHAQFGNFRAHYKYQHEPFYYCSIGDKQPKFYGENNEVSVWEVDRTSRNDFHPTQKPPELSARAINNSSQENAVIVEPFAGSGATMVSCQNLSRKCRAIEISPNYCAVILERMATAFPELDIHRVQ